MEFTLNEVEAACAKRLAELFKQGHTLWINRDPADLGLTQENYVPVLGTMEHYGLIDRPQGTLSRRFGSFHITAFAVQVARQLEKQEKATPEAPDIVEQTTKMVRSHPIMGYILLGVIALGGLLVIVDKVFALLERFGILKK